MVNKIKKFIGKAYISAIICALLLGGVMISVPSLFMSKKVFTGVEICLAIVLAFFSFCIIFGGIIQLIKDIKLKDSNTLIIRLCIGESVENLSGFIIKVCDSVLMSFAFAYYYLELKKEEIKEN